MEEITIEDRGPARVLTLRREHAGNAIGLALVSVLEAAMDDLEAEVAAGTGPRVLIVTGAGERFFCTGGDVKQYRALETRAQLDRAFARPRRLLDRLESLPLPVLAALDGLALGGGSELALACDLRVAGPGAAMGFPYRRLGVMPGWHGTERLLRAVGYPAAMELLLSGRVVAAEEGVRLGLFTSRSTRGSGLEAALALADDLAACAPLSLPAMKAALRDAWRAPAAEARARADEAFAALWLSADHREAETAFVERREPVFRGLSSASRPAAVESTLRGHEESGTMEKLEAERCEACRVGAPRVGDEEIAELHEQVPGWQLVERDAIRRLERVYPFDTFSAAMAYTNRVGELAEAEGHHPAILTEWGRVTVTWWSHKIKGLHRNDFIMAAKSDRLFEASAQVR